MRRYWRSLRASFGSSPDWARPIFRAAATRAGVTVTDIEVIEILDSVGPTTAGQLAELTGLTTGAITGMLNRLEEAGLVRRERDPNDGRRVIVQLVPGNDKMHEISAIFATLGTGWNEVVARYDDEQIALLLGFLKRGNELSRREITQLREAPSSGDEIFSAPLGDLESGRLIFPTGAVRLILRADAGMAELYQARFEGPAPDVKVKDGTVTVRYSRRTWLLDRRQRTAEVTLSTAIPWRIEFRGGAAEITAELGGLDLVGLEIKGGMSALHLNLPTPSGVVPIRISGGRQRSPSNAPQGSPCESTSKGGRQHLSSTINASAIWATTCGCKAATMMVLPQATTSNSQAPSPRFLSPPFDTKTVANVFTATWRRRHCEPFIYGCKAPIQPVGEW